jgi:hypothetical protein
MAKSKRSVTIDDDAPIPKRISTWPFEDLRVGKGAFYVEVDKHQAVRTAATRAGNQLGRTFSVRKVKDEKSEHFGKIAVYRLK